MTPVSYSVQPENELSRPSDEKLRERVTEFSRSAADPASAFVQARLSAQAIATYPGGMPDAPSDAYAIQDQAINAWPEPVFGWKVGRINGDDIGRYGTDRLAGPIFPSQIVVAGGSCIDMPVFLNGFAAVEGECVIIAGDDAPTGKTDWTRDEAIELIGAIHAGIEIASSPFPGINDFGPLVTISDFGNNFGLVIGDEIPNWQKLALHEWRFETLLDGVSLGSATPDSIPGGPVESFRFMLENAARRGLPLRKGAPISTGAITGVHVAGISQTAIVKAAGARDIEVRLTQAGPWTAAAGA
jgi:2-keto-4-pentenoate hydratase